MPTKIERPAVTSSPRVSATSRPETVEKPAAAQVQPTPFEPPAPEAAALNPKGRHIAATAEPGALWGDRPQRAQGFDAEAFRTLPPELQQKRLEEWQAQREAKGERIHQRVDALERRWKYMRLVTRAAALSDYETKCRALDPSTRAAVQAQLTRAEAAQQRIEEVQRRVSGLGKEKRPENAAERAGLAKELKAARAEQSAAVKEATRLIDDAGLKVDRLAQTEQVIDPKAPPPGQGSLLDDVLDWFSYTWQLFSVSSHVELNRSQEKNKKVERQVEQERLLDDRARQAMLRARLNEDLANRARLAKSGV